MLNHGIVGDLVLLDLVLFRDMLLGFIPISVLFVAVCTLEAFLDVLEGLVLAESGARVECFRTKGALKHDITTKIKRKKVLKSISDNFR